VVRLKAGQREAVTSNLSFCTVYTTLRTPFLAFSALLTSLIHASSTYNCESMELCWLKHGHTTPSAKDGVEAC
jgi:hypothetical protein